MSFGEDPPSCPESLSIPFPSVMFVYFCSFLVATILAIVCIRKYFKSIKVVGVKLRSTQFSVSAWVLYFAWIAFSSLLSAVQYGMEKEVEERVDNIFLALSCLFHGFTSFTLTYALHCHLKFRKADEKALLRGNATTTPAAPISNAVLRRLKQIQPAIDRFVILFIVFLLCYFVCVAVFLVYPENEAAEIAFISMYLILQLPSAWLIVRILSHQNPFQEEIFSKSKVFLGIATLFWMPDIIPLPFWAEILPGGCIFYFLSLVDIIHSIYASSIFFFFLFLRAEYHQNLAEEYWKTINEIQISGQPSLRAF